MLYFTSFSTTLLLPLLLVILILAPSPTTANTEKVIFTVNHSPLDKTTTTTHTPNNKVDQGYHGIPHPSKWYTTNNLETVIKKINNNNDRS